MVAVLHRPSLVVVGRTFHGQQRGTLALAQLASLGRGRGPRPDGVLGVPKVTRLLADDDVNMLRHTLDLTVTQA